MVFPFASFISEKIGQSEDTAKISFQLEIHLFPWITVVGASALLKVSTDGVLPS